MIGLGFGAGSGLGCDFARLRACLYAASRAISPLVTFAARSGASRETALACWTARPDAPTALAAFSRDFLSPGGRSATVACDSSQVAGFVFRATSSALIAAANIGSSSVATIAFWPWFKWRRARFAGTAWPVPDCARRLRNPQGWETAPRVPHAGFTARPQGTSPG